MKIELININKVEETKIPEGKRIAVHLHAFYMDILPLMVEYLNNIPVSFDLYVSIPENVSDISNTKILKSISHVQDIVVERTPNRGRDIAPFICTFGQRLMAYDYVLHLHTKKSPHAKSIKNWMPFILIHLLDSKENICRILYLLNNNYGIVGPPDFLITNPDGWGQNIKPAQQIINRGNLNIDLNKEYPSIDFIQGTMFWARTDYLKSFFNCGITYKDFPEEPIPVDGTIAHAFERLFCLWDYSNKFKFAKIYKSDIDLMRIQYLKGESTSFQDLISALQKTSYHSILKTRIIKFLLLIISFLSAIVICNLWP